MEAVSWLDTSGASLELTFCPVAAQTGNSGFCGIVTTYHIFCIRLTVRHKMDFWIHYFCFHSDFSHTKCFLKEGTIRKYWHQNKLNGKCLHRYSKSHHLYHRCSRKLRNKDSSLFKVILSENRLSDPRIPSTVWKVPLGPVHFSVSLMYVLVSTILELFFVYLGIKNRF